MNFVFPHIRVSTGPIEPQIVEGSSHPPCPPWSSLQKPPSNGWWATRQPCECPPCYFILLRQQIDRGELPSSVSLPLSQLMDVGLLRLSFKHPDHDLKFTQEDKQYAMAAYRSLCVEINGGRLPRQLLEILMRCSQMAVFRALSGKKPEFEHREFEMKLKRALHRDKPSGDAGSCEEAKGKREEDTKGENGHDDETPEAEGDDNDENTEEEIEKKHDTEGKDDIIGEEKIKGEGGQEDGNIKEKEIERGDIVGKEEIKGEEDPKNENGKEEEIVEKDEAVGKDQIVGKEEIMGKDSVVGNEDVVRDEDVNAKESEGKKDVVADGDVEGKKDVVREEDVNGKEGE